MTRLAALILALVAAPALASPQTAVAAAVADARRLPPEVACRTRYLYLPPYQRMELVVAVKFWANCLSREVDFGTPRVVADGLLAVVLDDYRWDARVWEQQFQTEPYFYYHVRAPGRPEGLELRARTGSRVPLVGADWWLFYASRQVNLQNQEYGHGYYDWLGIKDQKTFEALRGTDKKQSIKIGDELRAVVEASKSGVTVEGVDRQIEWYATYGDGEQGLWLTLDATNTSGGNTAAGNLAAGEFRFEATEAFVGLPNRLWAVGAFNARGARQATVPPEIANDNSDLHRGNDRRIHPFSCIHCHDTGGLKAVDDWARNRGLKAPNQLDAFKVEEFLRLKRQYFRDLDAQLAKGRRRYAEALRECVGLSPEKAAALHAQVYYGYLRQRSPNDVAGLLGVAEEDLAACLKRFFDRANPDFEGKKRLANLSPLKDGRAIGVTHLEQFFGDLVCIVRGHR